MKKVFILILLSMVYLTINAQSAQQQQMSESSDEGRASLSVGVLRGGGGLVGADFEALLSDRVGLQLGAGWISYGFGLNYSIGAYFVL